MGKDHLSPPFRLTYVLPALWALRATPGQSELPGLRLCEVQHEVPRSALQDLKLLFHVTQPSRVMGILRAGLQGMGRLGPIFSIYPIWDTRCNLGSKFHSKLGYDAMLVFDALALSDAIGLHGGALFSCREGVITASAPIPCAETLCQVVMLGRPRHLRPANNLVIYDSRFMDLKTTAMAIGGNTKAAKDRRSSLVRGHDLLDSSVEWLSAELWQCPICSCCNLNGMLLCICCESMCLFQKDDDQCAFTPIGRQALMSLQVTVPTPGPPDADCPDGKSATSHPADPGVSCDSIGKHECTTKYKNVVGRDGNGKLRHFLVPPSMERKSGHGRNAIGEAASRKRRAPVDDHDREPDGEIPPPFPTLGRVAPERRASPKRYGANPGVSCDTDLGEVEELD